jgi:hypothetical protein
VRPVVAPPLFCVARRHAFVRRPPSSPLCDSAVFVSARVMRGPGLSFTRGSHHDHARTSVVLFSVRVASSRADADPTRRAASFTQTRRADHVAMWTPSTSAAGTCRLTRPCRRPRHPRGPAFFTRAWTVRTPSHGRVDALRLRARGSRAVFTRMDLPCLCGTPQHIAVISILSLLSLQLLLFRFHHVLVSSFCYCHQHHTGWSELFRVGFYR